MENHITMGNSHSMATTVAAGINLDWDWNEYSNLMTGAKPTLACPVCDKQKSKEQVVCQVCYTNILDSRNGSFPERWKKVEPVPTCSQG